jgi:hypothetical protein
VGPATLRHRCSTHDFIFAQITKTTATKRSKRTISVSFGIPNILYLLNIHRPDTPADRHYVDRPAELGSDHRQEAMGGDRIGNDPPWNEIRRE